MTSPLRLRAFRLLALGRMVTMLGNAVAPIALAFAVLDLSGSVADLGVVVGARSAVNVLFLLVGGVVADRVPRRVVMVASSLLAAASQAAVAVLLVAGSATVAALAVLAAANGMVAAFALPATSALVAEIVPADQRQKANAINRMGTNSALIVGAAAGASAVAAFGPATGIVLDAASFAVAAVCFALIGGAGAGARKPGNRSLLRDLREGWREVAGRRWLWVVVCGACAVNAAIAGGLHVIGPAVADATIGRAMWGLVLGAQTAGMVVGGLVAMRLRMRRLLAFGVACVAGGALLPTALALAGPIGVVSLAAAAFLTGVSLEQLMIGWDTTMQQEIPAASLARVYSIEMMGSYLAIPVGQVAAGPLVGSLGARNALLVMASAIVVAVVAMLADRQVRSLEHRAVAATADP